MSPATSFLMSISAPISKKDTKQAGYRLSLKATRGRCEGGNFQKTNPSYAFVSPKDRELYFLSPSSLHLAKGLAHSRNPINTGEQYFIPYRGQCVFLTHLTQGMIYPHFPEENTKVWRPVQDHEVSRWQEQVWNPSFHILNLDFFTKDTVHLAYSLAYAAQLQCRAEHSIKQVRQSKGRGESTQGLFSLPPPLYLLSISHISTIAVFQIQHGATLGSNDTRYRQAPNNFFSLFSTAQILILMFPESRTSPRHMKGKSLGMSYNSSQ